MYVTFDNGQTWSETQKLVASDGISNGEFGISVAVYRDMLVVGGWFDNQQGVNAGPVSIPFT